MTHHNKPEQNPTPTSLPSPILMVPFSPSYTEPANCRESPSTRETETHHFVLTP
ncbi:hypothetical protein N657DRAFT_20769 [Parathielavia appendiculata]|uniref:Uncharacterized protein n=1 Tax=Parathielavia appendiculata TaxID=2587402 RepID=A0AAN6U937_9PEZI|nr:hypothetical protein N657DRAFT_20769 [Parathielavia appendiculata]